ncbi:hypothetical protein ACKEPL_07545 [Acinetobacter baumannii]|uniref:hypothetical protein n=1 Tax=Acinetobacter baumannii TaxID=470 RepID=UPI00186B8EAF|nr:hypothetical protein [Acinetobacter baumannii]MBE4724211.1 hypothetical protein [Acinetobacter baumannii]MDH2527939.1 hypothetical protein [Acinetobacter baumannii]
MNFDEDLAPAPFVLDLNFSCKKCGNDLSRTIRIPEPNYHGYGDYGIRENHDYIVCDKCEHEEIIDILCDYDNHYFSCTLRDTGEEIGDGSPYYDESESELNWIIGTSTHYETFRQQLNDAEDLNKAIEESSPLKNAQNIMIYAHIVAAIEGFIGSTFIHYVLTHDKLLKKFLKVNKDFKDVKISLTAYTKNTDPLRAYVEDYLDKFIFHRIDKVNPIFKGVLGFDFKNKDWLFKAVAIRHDCVHRAGFKKDKSRVIITEEDISELIANAQELGVNIYDQIQRLEEELNTKEKESN